MSSNLRIGGLASGMDIDQLVSNLMKAERIKVDKLTQEKQLLEWKQEEYRTINSTLRSFRDNQVFKMKLSSTFLTKQVTSSNKDAVSVSASAAAFEGTHTISVSSLAKGASITGNKIESKSDKTTLSSQLNGLNGVVIQGTRSITINNTVFQFDTSTDNINTLIQRINNHKSEGVSLNITQKAVDATENVSGKPQEQTIRMVDEALQKGLIIKIGDKSVGLYDNTSGYTTNAASAMGVDYAYNIDELNSEGQYTHKFQDLFVRMQQDFSSEKATLSLSNPDNPMSLTIISNKEGTADAVTATVSGGKEWTVRASYDETVDRFFLSTSKTGADQTINLIESDLTKALNISDLTDSGKDAKITLDGLELTYKSNQFTLNNVTYNLHNTTTSDVNISLSQDTDSVLKSIKSFVEEYNKILVTLESKINEDRYKDYTWPLSDDQRESLTDDQINMWKEKARSGMLRNDDTLRQLRDKMRSTVAGLSKLGITTTADYTTGKLEITELGEEKLRKAISDDLDGVMELFSDSQQGVAQKLSDAMSLTINNIVDKAGMSGSKKNDDSYLGERIDGLMDNIDDWEDRLVDIEDRYWKKFSAMEAALNKLNQQSSWLSQMSSNS